MISDFFSFSHKSIPHEFLVVSSLSRISGTCSVLVWLFAQLPQVLENYRNASVSGVSPSFLSCWIAGDLTNLIGCLLTGALPFQTCLAAYYCFIDVILSIQYWYYTKVYPHQAVHHNMLQSPNMMRPVKSNGSVKGMLSARLNRFEASPHARGMSAHRSNSSARRRPRKPRRSFFQQVLSGSVLSTTFGKASAHPVADNVDVSQIDKQQVSAYLAQLGHIMVSVASKVGHSAALVGTCSGWLSTTFYVCSRAPQILKNYRSKSTSGVSPFLFILAMTGNILYTTSISSDLYLLSQYDFYLGDSNFKDVLLAQLPFLVGSSGTVIFDAIILCQFWIYSGNGESADDITHPTKPHLVSRKSAKSSKSAKSAKSHEDSSSLDLHFTKPDWYTNNYNHVVDSGISYDHDQQKDLRNHRENYREDTDSEFPHREERDGARPNERSHLIPSYIIDPPSHYVISTSQSSSGPQQHNRKMSFTGTFSAIARSVSNSSMMRSPTAVFQGSNFSNQAGSPYAGTALLPSLVGTYSSLSKKMADESKKPFSPIDFLHDDFLHRSGGSGGDRRYSGQFRF